MVASGAVALRGVSERTYGGAEDEQEHCCESSWAAHFQDLTFQRGPNY